MIESFWTGRKDKAVWQRLGSMLVLAVCYGVAETVLLLVVGWQVVTMVTGRPIRHEQVRRLGGLLSGYIYQIFLYLTGNTEQRPFPFTPWPLPPA